jgi:hypothetical protein
MAGSSFNMGRTLMPAVTTLTSKTMMPPMSDQCALCPAHVSDRVNPQARQENRIKSFSG